MANNTAERMKAGKTYKIFLKRGEVCVYGYFLNYIFYEGPSLIHRAGFIDPEGGYFYRQTNSELLPRHVCMGRLKGMTLQGVSGLTYWLEES